MKREEYVLNRTQSWPQESDKALVTRIKHRKKTPLRTISPGGGELGNAA